MALKKNPNVSGHIKNHGGQETGAASLKPFVAFINPSSN